MGIYCCFEIVYKMQISKALDCNVLEYMLVSRFIAKFFKIYKQEIYFYLKKVNKWEIALR